MRFFVCVSGKKAHNVIARSSLLDGWARSSRESERRRRKKKEGGEEMSFFPSVCTKKAIFLFQPERELYISQFVFVVYKSASFQGCCVFNFANGAYVYSCTFLEYIIGAIFLDYMTMVSLHFKRWCHLFFVDTIIYFY